MPEWFATAVLGAVIAALGYVAKLAVEGFTSWRGARAARRNRLLELESLLLASREVFLTQRRLVGQLERSLRENHPAVTPDRSGFEQHFARAFEHFTPDEAELHTLIRGMTEHAMRPLNEALLDWLSSDLTYRTAHRAEGRRGELAAKLNQLNTHLVLWHAKYRAWIPENPSHALVYLADEERHGVGFPTGIEDVVGTVLRGESPRVEA